MKINATIDYSAPPKEVFAMLADEEFQTRKCEATGALRHSVSVSARGERTVIVSKRDLPTERLPSFVKSLVGATLAVTETQDWGPAGKDGTRLGTLTVDISGTPIALDGSVSLAPGGQGSIYTVLGDLKAKVPLVGAKLEQAAAPAIQSAIRVEGETAVAWLASRK